MMSELKNTNYSFIKSIRSLLNNDLLQAGIVFVPLVYFTELSTFITGFKEEPILSIIVLLIIYALVVMVVYLIHKLNSSSDAVFNGEVRTILDEVIKDASRNLCIVSPFISPGNVVTEDILSQARNKVKVKCVINSSQLNSIEVFNFYERLNATGGEMYCHPRLHSKIYMNDKVALVTSLNLLTSSFDNSSEAGVKINDKYNRSSILDYIEKDLLQSDLVQKVQKEDFSIKFGFCIRTKRKITLNPLRPVEYNEFRSSGNSTAGQYCHLCGEKQ